jgi:hypoxia up-regulated 1
MKQIIKSSRDSLAAQHKKAIKDEDDLDDDEATAPESPEASLFQLDEDSVNSLDSVVTEAETWLTQKIAAQEKLDPWEEPVLLLTEIERKASQVQLALQKAFLDQTKKTKPKTSTSATTTSTSSTSTETPTVTTEEKPLHTEVEDDDFEEADTTTETITSTIIVEAASTEERKHEEL